MVEYEDEPLWLTTYAESIRDEVEVIYWDDDAIDDPVYALLFYEENDAWVIAGMKTILELGL
jgi:hypothetical protein